MVLVLNLFYTHIPQNQTDTIKITINWLQHILQA